MPNISAITLNGNEYAIGPAYTTMDLDYDNIFEEIAKRFNRVPKIKYQCHNCGGTLEIKTDEYIFKCPYCRTAYAIGTNQINSRY